jgi:hypothetical protein
VRVLLGARQARVHHRATLGELSQEGARVLGLEVEPPRARRRPPGARNAETSEFQCVIWSAPASTNCRASMPVGT